MQRSFNASDLQFQRIGKILFLSIFLCFTLFNHLSAQGECVIVIQGTKKAGEGDFIRQSANIFIRGMGEFPGPPTITVLRPTSLPNDMGGTDNPTRDEVAYANKKALLEALEKAFCNEDCKNVVIATIGHGMGNAAETSAKNDSAGGIKIGSGTTEDDFITAEDIANIINKCPKGVKIFSSHCFAGSMVNGIKKHLNDPSVIGVGVASSAWDKVSFGVNGYYEFIKNFLQDYYKIIKDPNVMKEMEKRAEELKKEMAKKKAEHKKEIEELEKQIKEKEAALKECEEARDAINKEIEELKKKKEALDKEKEMLEKLKQLEKEYQDAKDATTRNALKGKTSAEKRALRKAKSDKKKELDAQKKAMRDAKVKYSTNSKYENRIKFLDERLGKIEQEKTDIDDDLTKKNADWMEKNKACIKLEFELEELREKLKNHVLLPDRNPLMEAVIHESFKSAKANTKTSDAIEPIEPTVAGVTLPGKPMVTVATDNLWYTFYKVKDASGKCWIVGWVANRLGVPLYPIKSQSCKEDCTEAKFTYTDKNGDHTVEVKKGNDGKYKCSLDGNNVDFGFLGIGTELKIGDKKIGKVVIRARLGDDPEVTARGGVVTDIRYTPPFLRFKVKFKDSKEAHEIKIEFLPHGGRKITVDNNEPYTLAMYHRSSLFDGAGVRRGEYCYVVRDASLDGILWLERNNETYPFSAILNTDGSLPGITVATALGIFTVPNLTIDISRPRWSSTSASGEMQSFNANMPVIEAAQGTMRRGDVGASVILTWGVNSVSGASDESDLSGIRILKYSGKSDHPDVIDFPANVRSFTDIDVQMKESYEYHIMTVAENNNHCECQDKQDFPSYSFSEVVEVGKKHFPIIWVTAGALAAGGTAILLTSNGSSAEEPPDDDTTAVDLPPEALCQNVEVELDGNGNATITVDQIDAGSNDDIGIVSRTLNQSTFTCLDLGATSVTLTVTDISGNEGVCFSLVTVDDRIPPTVQCEDITLSLDSDGTITIDLSDLVTGSDNCELLIDSGPLTYTCNDIGMQSLEIEVEDNSGNAAMCNSSITITDDMPPEIQCRDLTLSLGPDGTVEVNADDLVSMRSDNCGEVVVTANPSSLSCGETSVHEVTITATDENGNTSECIATVTIEDDEEPQITCADVTVELDANGGAEVTPDVEASDNCDTSPTITVVPAQVTCSDLGVMELTVTATDAAGNTATCTARLTVVDDSDPVISCQDIVLQLDSDGTASVLPEDLVTSATDNCTTDLTLIASPTVLLCDDIGLRDVEVVATDASGNQSSCVAIITLEDNISPVANCQDITVSLEPSGTVTLNGQDIASGSDNCGFVEYIVDPAQLTAENIGDNLVTVTLIDPSGNTTTCEAIVTVSDLICELTISDDTTPSYCGLETGSTEIFIEEPGDYFIEWSNGITGTIIDNVGPGNYTVTITDNELGCMQVYDVVIGEEPFEYLVLESVQPGDCVNPAGITFTAISPGQGPIIIEVNSPEGTFELQLANGETTTLGAALPGTYTLTAWDQAAGQQCSSVLIVEPEFQFTILELEVTAEGNALFGNVITPYPQNTPFTFLIDGALLGTSNTPEFFFTFTNTDPFLLQVIDAAGCDSEAVLIVPGIGSQVGISMVQSTNMYPAISSDFQNKNADQGIEHATWEIQGLSEMIYRTTGASLLFQLNDHLDLLAEFTSANGQAVADISKGPTHTNLPGNFRAISLGTGVRLSPQKLDWLYVSVGARYGELMFYPINAQYSHLQISDHNWSGQLGAGAQFTLQKEIVIDAGLRQNVALSGNRHFSGLQMYLRLWLNRDYRKAKR